MFYKWSGGTVLLYSKKMAVKILIQLIVEIALDM